MDRRDSAVCSEEQPSTDRLSKQLTGTKVPPSTTITLIPPKSCCLYILTSSESAIFREKLLKLAHAEHFIELLLLLAFSKV